MESSYKLHLSMVFIHYMEEDMWITYLIKYAGCPINWASKMQTEIALSTTEDEYIALSTSTRDLILLRSMMLELTSILKLPYTTLTLRCTLFEDNKGAEELAKVPKYQPRTKHIAIKYLF